MENLKHLEIGGEDWLAFNSVDFQDNCWVKVLT